MQNKKGINFIFGTAIISGFSIFINKFGVSITNPDFFAFAKNLIVAIILTGLLLYLYNWQIFRKIGKKDWANLILIGLLGGSVPFLLFFEGLSMTTAAQGSFIHKSMFLPAALFAWLFLREKLNAGFFIGGIFLFLGNLVLLKKMEFSINAGDLFILLATIFWALENVISKKILKKINWAVVAWGRMFFGSLFILAFLLFSGKMSEAASLNFSQIGWIILTSIILFGYQATWYKGLKHVPVGVATAILALGSPITIALSAIYNRKLDLNEIISFSVIIAGIVAILGFEKIASKLKKTINHEYFRT